MVPGQPRQGAHGPCFSRQEFEGTAACLRGHGLGIVRERYGSTADSARFIRRGRPHGALLREAEEADPDGPEDADVDDAVFELERQLQDFIAHNLESIRVGDKRLKLYTENGVRGIEYQTGEIGRIDILAVDQEQGFVVFELKRGNAPDRAIGQLARYMGWVKTHLANGRPVHGVIVAREISSELRYAIAAFPNVELFEYQIDFMLNRIEQTVQQR
ncbi:endonuclease NucS domain-containing protein [Burkholderia thailandensis]|uniref:endonuclease NucS domain-containing protein n=1 Tax=Burkholderia thailandensis TaxID=57975 RepID=UPI001EE32933|nr:endonuclease NucS domain-containing protein [Burkholderia thailandensis]